MAVKSSYPLSKDEVPENFASLARMHDSLHFLAAAMKAENSFTFRGAYFQTTAPRKSINFSIVSRTGSFHSSDLRDCGLAFLLIFILVCLYYKLHNHASYVVPDR